jgi:hypothetical protein
MSKSYGGVHPNMRELIMKQHDGYFGMHSRTLEVGNTQSFTFSSTEDGPFWMDHAEIELNHHDQILPSPSGLSRMQHKTISELKAELAPYDILNG